MQISTPLRLTAVSAAALLTPLAASAQDIQGTFGLNYVNNTSLPTDFTQTDFYGAIGSNLNMGGSGLYVQGDISNMSYDPGMGSWTGVTGHVGTEISGGMTAAAYFGIDNNGDTNSDSTHYGAELAFDAPGMMVEGYIGAREFDGTTGYYLTIGGDADFAIPGVSLAGANLYVTGGVHTANWSEFDFDFTRLSLGAKIAFSSGPSIFASFESGTISDAFGSVDTDAIAVGAEFALGDGATFGRRTWGGTLGGLF